ncbi:MAG: hypothetical protein GEU90_02420 [Gemmatimonas sp.]|nr:hypothetical protein [Gemmatimonas sp.]
MSGNRRIPAMLSVGILLLAAGCRDEYETPTEPNRQRNETISATVTREPDRRLERPHEASFHELARSIRGFAGYYFSEEGTLVALLQDLGEEEVARRLLDTVLRQHQVSDRQQPPGRIRFETAQFSFLELAAWRDRASDQVLDVPGVQFTDLDEVQNRFVVGVSRSSAREAVTRVLAENDVPLAAVVVEEVGTVQDFLTLRDSNRPIEGGFQVQRGGGGICTIGFNAYRSSTQVLLTNSHCTSSFWNRDTSLFYQNDTSPGSNLAAFETADPAPFPCGFFGLNKCRWSDAAGLRKYPSVPWNYGKLARTTSWATGAGNAGSITVNSDNPRMTITGEYPFPIGGEMFDKMGRTTGWTYGFVKKTCVDVNKSEGRRLLCQDWIHKMHATFGDSGSPIFRWHGNTVTLAGLLWGGITQGGTPYILMSAMWNIEKDLGALSTF